MGIAANKSDMYEYEEVPEATGKSFAQEVNSSFNQTSAKGPSGIDVINITLILGYVSFNRFKGN